MILHLMDLFNWLYMLFKKRGSIFSSLGISRSLVSTFSALNFSNILTIPTPSPRPELIKNIVKIVNVYLL